MKKLIVHRILAFAIDYLIILMYALVLFGITLSLDLGKLSPFLGQLIGFLTLTLPVFLYFYFMERSSSAATFGKQIMNISVDSGGNNQSVLYRNILKFLPWEIAHLGVHWIVYYSSIDLEPPLWVWVVLIIPQVVVFGYFISIFLFKGESSFYDKMANTRIQIKLGATKK